MSNRSTPHTARVRVTVYLTAEAWEAMARLAMDAGRSMSGHASDVLMRYLQRQGFDSLPEAPNRAHRSDFDASRTLEQALKVKETLLAKQLDRNRAKLEKVQRLRAKAAR